MAVLISETQRRSISSMQGSAAFFGVPAIVLGVLLRVEYFPSGYAKPIISEMTDGYYGVMSGSLVGLLGIFGWTIIRSRQVNVVVLCLFALLACDVLCLLDLLMVVPQVKAHGKFAWDYSESLLCNIHTGFRPADNPFDKLCEKYKISAILLICITATVSMASLLTLINTFKTCLALCKAQSETAIIQPARVQLAPVGPVQPAQGCVALFNTQFALFQAGAEQY